VVKMSMADVVVEVKFEPSQVCRVCESRARTGQFPV
jgi:hypothetical protein